MNWQEAWERDKHAVGRAVHEAWAAEKVRQGFADHAFTRDASGQGLASMCDVCGAESSAKHHTDMLDYDDLAPHIQQYDIETGIVGYRMGYEAAQREAA